MLKYFGLDLFVSFIAFVIAGWWAVHDGGTMATLLQGIFIVAVLALMEISLSFDNAVINASVLRGWDAVWKKIFLTIGMLIAVFGMRLVFPIVIVAFTAKLSLSEVIQMALNDPKAYSARLIAHHAEIATFGGVFLLMVFLNFFFDKNKEVDWLKPIEKVFRKFSHVQGMSIFITLILLLTMVLCLAKEADKSIIVMAGMWGMLIYLGVQVLSALIGGGDSHHGGAGEAIMKGGFAGFLYLEVLDASFSFDGVIGAFAITSDVIFIMLGLAIGAMFVRSLTIWLVDKGTLTTYRYLEHGAHYAIGALAIIMLLSIRYHIPEVVTGLIGFLFLLVSFLASVAYNRKQRG